MLVISRLLHTKLSQRSNPPRYLESLRTQLASLRRKLLVKIDQRFQSIDIAGETLVEAMCAFVLATSSSPTDVLRHFHHVRLESMAHRGRDNDYAGQGMHRALQIYIHTLKDTNAYIPGQLAVALQLLKSTPLFKSLDVHSLLDLNLDVHEQWVSDDIKLFTPYIRHEDLQRSEVARILKEWARRAFGSFIGELRGNLQSINEITIVTELRTRLLKLWLCNPQRNVGIDVSEVLDGLRDVFNARLTWLIKSQAMALQKFGEVIEETLDSLQSRGSNLSASFWASSMTLMEITDGGRTLINTLIDRSRGRNTPLQVRLLEYTAWLQRIEAIEAIIKDMQGERWEEAIDDIEAEDDLLEDTQVLLSEDDPRLLQSELRDSLEKSFSSFQDQVRTWAQGLEGPDRGQKAIYLLRLWREIRQSLPRSFQHLDLGLDSIPPLHQIVAITAIAAPWQACQRRIRKLVKNNKILGRPLWEGNPELPVLPSAWAFRLLHELVTSMTSLGSDIWSPLAADVLKQQIRRCLALRLGKLTESINQVNGGTSHELHGEEDDPQELHVTTVNGEIQGSSSDTLESDSVIQRIFDLLYLGYATAQKRNSAGDDPFLALRQSLEAEVELLEGSMERMRRDADEYWKRTALLFALLA